MFRSLYSQLATQFLLLFIAIAIVITAVVGHMLPDTKFHELVIGFAIGGAAFASLVSLILFRVLTRRLRLLTDVMLACRDGGFDKPPRLDGANPDGDEIARLGFVFTELTQRMAEQLSQLRQSDRHRRELLANVSHDLRTPMAAMQGYLETLLLKETELPADERRSYLEIAHKHCERLSRLVANLFELSKLDAREVVPQLEPIALAELAQDIVQKFELAARSRQIVLSASLGDDLALVDADISLMEHVLQNLIENALRHTNPGGAVRVSILRNAGDIEVRVSDTGDGISAAELPHIFDRFYRIGAEHTEHGGGAGLGLAIVKRKSATARRSASASGAAAPDLRGALSVCARASIHRRSAPMTDRSDRRRTACD